MDRQEERGGRERGWRASMNKTRTCFDLVEPFCLVMTDLLYRVEMLPVLFDARDGMMFWSVL